jgi:hypothetical protein
LPFSWGGIVAEAELSASPSAGDYTRSVTDLGKLLVIVGGGLVLIGLVVMLVGKSQLPLGRLPGDIVYRGKNTSFYVPLTTSILLSVVLSLVLYVISRLRR